MKKRIIVILLAVCTIFAQTQPAVAEEVLLIEENMTEQTLEENTSESSADIGASVDMIENVEEVEMTSEIDSETALETEFEIETDALFEKQSETTSDASEIVQDELILDNIIIEEIDMESEVNEDMLTFEHTEGLEATEYAAGSSMSTATPVSIGSNYTGEISTSNKLDYYRFTIPSSGRINLITSAYMSKVDYYIYDSLGKELWHSIPVWNDITKIISTNNTVDLTSGTYYFAISRYAYSTSLKDGKYSFVINFATANESFTETGSGSNNSMASANIISLNSEYRGQIARNDKVDFYQFTLQKSGRITLTTLADISTVDYYIHDSTGKELWHIIPSWNTTTKLISTSNTIDLTAGTYYFVISYYAYSTSSPTGNYTFQLSSMDAGESFAESGNGTNNTIYAANPIALQTRYQGQLALNDSKDFYQFTVASSGNITVAVNAGIYRAYFKIYDSAGKEKWSTRESWNSTTQRIDFSKEVKLTAGTYYFVVEKYDNNTGNYSFSLSAHVHSYTYTVTKATTSSNGKIVGKCSCGETDTSTIYRPGSTSLSPSSYVYDGKAKRPSVTVWASDGKVIGPENYTVTYGKGRKDVGSYSVTITFKGNYSGTLQRYFYIYPKKTSIARLTAKSRGFSVKINKKKKQVSGYQIQYAGNKAFRKAKTKELNGSSKVSATYSGLKAKKKYFVRVRTYKKVGSQRYYSAWSNVKTIVTKR